MDYIAAKTILHCYQTVRLNLAAVIFPFTSAAGRQCVCDLHRRGNIPPASKLNAILPDHALIALLTMLSKFKYGCLEKLLFYHVVGGIDQNIQRWMLIAQRKFME